MNEPTNLREAMRAVERAETAAVRPATMVRLSDAMHRLERLADAMEKAAEEAERQLGLIKGRL